MIQQAIRAYQSKDRAVALRRYFKTGPGEYGEGDQFLGLTVPQSREIVKKYAAAITDQEIVTLITSPWHEERLIALLFLVDRYARARTLAERRLVLRRYLAFRRHINNWDLVDVSTHKILGAFCAEAGNRTLMKKLLRSKRHWDRRMAIIATFAFLRQGDTAPTFEFARALLSDREDLMHKATGWALREAGKRDPDKLRGFLAQNGRRMPRTMLRYAIERFSATERKRIMTSTR